MKGLANYENSHGPSSSTPALRNILPVIEMKAVRPPDIFALLNGGIALDVPSDPSAPYAADGVVFESAVVAADADNGGDEYAGMSPTQIHDRPPPLHDDGNDTDKRDIDASTYASESRV